MYSKTIQKLIEIFKKFPTVGPKTATRFVFYLIETPNEKIEELINAIRELKKETKICPLCFRAYSGRENLCPICNNPKRDHHTICVVEKDIDLEAIEKTNKYKGVYFVLGGTITNFENQVSEKLIKKRLKNLLLRINQDKGIKEIILALNPTMEGQSTSLWVQKNIEKFCLEKNPERQIKITHLAKGLPVGGELEYADPETLSSAFENRK